MNIYFFSSMFTSILTSLLATNRIFAYSFVMFMFSSSKLNIITTDPIQVELTLHLLDFVIGKL